MAVFAAVRFGVYELDRAGRELRKQGVRLKLQDQPFKLLEALLERPGELVTREELQQRLWSTDTFVDFDQSLNRAVNRVREALGDDAEVPRYVETVPRRGYRFIAPVCEGPRVAGDARIETTSPGSVADHKGPVRKTAMYSIIATLVSVTLVAVAILKREAAPEVPVIRVNIGPPDNASFVRADGVIGSIAVSPDGRRILFGARSGSRRQLWIRDLDQLTAKPLAGTEDAQVPFWSPDSASIAFSAGGKLKTMQLSGGRLVTVADTPALRGGTWNRRGIILFSSDRGEPLRSVPATGGTVTVLSHLDTARAHADHLWPSFLPDGRRFLFSTTEAPNLARWTIRVGSLDSADTHILRQADSEAVFAGGYLLYQWESVLMAQPFDPKRLTTLGTPLPVAENLGCLASGKGSFAVSAAGMLAYGTRQDAQLMWLDRNGAKLSTVGVPCPVGRLHLSHDGKRASVAVTTGSHTNLWIYDVRSGIRTRLTFEPGTDMIGVWSPDDRTIIFDSSRKGRHDLYQKASDGTGREDLLHADSAEKGPSSWAPDGSLLLYNSLSAKSRWGIWVLPLKPKQGAPLPYPFIDTAFNEQQGQFSPDGKWVLYSSDESGRNEIYAARFPAARDKRRISLNGGTQPRWRRDGAEIFYIAPEGTLMAVEVKTTLEIVATRPLFKLPLAAGQGFSYDVSADGRRFLTKTSVGGSSAGANDTLTLVQGWADGLKR